MTNDKDLELIKKEYENGKSYREIGEMLGLNYVTIMYHAKRLGIKSRKPWDGRVKYTYNIGDKIGKLLILEKEYSKKNKQNIYKCKCDCGITDYFYKDSLLGGQSQCWECHKVKLGNQLWKGYGEISGSYWNQVIRGANKRNIDLLIDIKYAWDIFLNQKRLCALSGRLLTFERKHKLQSKNQTASLDRINSNLGYIENNIQWIHKDINSMKMDLDEQTFIEICNEISEYRKNK